MHADHYLIMPNTELLLICDSEYSVALKAVSAFPSVNVCLPKNDHGVRWLIDLVLEGSARCLVGCGNRVIGSAWAVANCQPGVTLRRWRRVVTLS